MSVEKSSNGGIKFIVTEMRLENKKSINFKDNGTIEWCSSANKATIFESVEKAQKEIEKYFGDDDFGLAIFKVHGSKMPDGKIKWTYVLKNGAIPVGYKELKLEDITEDIIELNVGKNLINKYLSSESLMYKNRTAIKGYAFESIHKLINLHNNTNIKFTRTTTLASQKGGMHCQGCIICDRIEEYVKLINHPALSKFYSHLIGDERGRFVEFIENTKGTSAEKFGDSELGELSYLMRDFVALRKQEYHLGTIADFLGCGKSRFHKYYDALAGSKKYCWVIGRNKPIFQTDPDFTRLKIDPQF